MRIPRVGTAAVAGAALLATGVVAVPALAGTMHPASNRTILTVDAESVGGGSSSSQPGSTVWLTEALRIHGHRVGTSYVACTVVTTSVDECTETWDFGTNGSIQGAGDNSLSVMSATGTQLAVTGGTGALENEQGSAAIRLVSSDGAIQYTFDLSGRVPPALR